MVDQVILYSENHLYIYLIILIHDNQLLSSIQCIEQFLYLNPTISKKRIRPCSKEPSQPSTTYFPPSLRSLSIVKFHIYVYYVFLRRDGLPISLLHGRFHSNTLFVNCVLVFFGHDCAIIVLYFSLSILLSFIGFHTSSVLILFFLLILLRLFLLYFVLLLSLTAFAL